MVTYFIISGCPSIVPGASAGVIYSPNFPWNYSNSKSCEWFITTPWRKKINLKFTKFSLESSFGSCEYDSAEVRKENYYLIGKYCGSQIPSFVTSSSSLRVRFTSDRSTTSSGFMAFYQTEYSFPTEAPTYYWTTNPPPITWTYPYTYHDVTTYRPDYPLTTNPPPFTWTYPYTYHDVTTYRPDYPLTAARIYTCEYNSQTSKLSFSITILIQTCGKMWKMTSDRKRLAEILKQAPLMLSLLLRYA